VQKLALFENIIGICSALFVIYSNDTLKNLYASFTGKVPSVYKSPKEMTQWELWRHRFLMLLGVLVFIYLSVWPVISSIIFRDNTEERTKYTDAHICIQTGCEPAVCLATFKAQFPNSEFAAKLNDEIAGYLTPRFCMAVPTPTPVPTPSSPKPDPSPEHSPSLEAMARSQRLAALKSEAALWLDRKSPAYRDFLPALSAVANDRELGNDENDALNTLQKAAQVVRWKDSGLHAATMTALPIIVVDYKTDGLADRVARRLGEKLKSETFDIVTSYADAALIVEIHDAKPNVGTYDHGGQYRSTTSFWLRATWVGGAPFFDEQVSRTKFATGLGFDAVNSGGHEAETESFDDAVASATSLFLSKISQQ
jgi:hypothetical protein